VTIRSRWLSKKVPTFKGLLDSGKMTQESADKICETVKFEISKAPVTEEKKEAAPAPAKAPVKGGVEF
jgi:hypothetical protein